MHFFQKYYKNIIVYDLINKFNYSTLNEIPYLTKIVLNFGLKKKNIKSIVSRLLALELIGGQKSKITFSSVSNVTLKIRKGNPVGCKITLRKHSMYTFLSNLILNILPKIKQFKNFYYKNLTSDSFSFRLKNLFLFIELETYYEFFKDLDNLNITLVSNSRTKNEFYYLLRSLKFPINK